MTEQTHQYWDGSQWVKGQRIQAPQRGADRLFTVPTASGWRVDLGKPANPIRYWDGATTRFSVDNAGIVSANGIYLSQVTSSTPAVTIDSSGASSGNATVKLLDTGANEVVNVTTEGQFKVLSSGDYRCYNAAFSGQALARLWRSGLDLGDGTTNDVGFTRSAAVTFQFFGTNSVEWGSDQSALDSGDGIRLHERTAPGTPAANFLHLYAKDLAGVSRLYYKDDAGVEHGPL